MAGKSPEVSPAWLDPDKLIDFLDELRGAKYNIGVSQYIAAQDLILALKAKGEQLDRPQRLKSLLGPLLCSSRAEQEDFQKRFDQWIEERNFDFHGDEQEGKQAKELERELIKIERKSRWFWWGLTAITTFIAVGLIYLLIQQWPFLTPTPIPTPIPTPTPTPTPIPTPTPKPNPIPFAVTWELGTLLFLPFLFLIIWRIWWWWRARLYLKRRATKQQPEIQRVSISGFEEELFPTVLFLRIAQGFRQRIRVPSIELNIQKTIEKTLRNGGWFTPVYGYRQVRPEYLVLIDRASYGDHQGRFFQEMINRLRDNEVFITGYYFDGEPRVCFPMTKKGPPRRLQEIAAKYSNSQYRLILFSDADGLFSSLTGKLEPWLDVFSSWSERAILTPKPSQHWGYQELELSRQFIVLPATNDGLIELVRSIQYGESPDVLSEEGNLHYS
ncbi:hypothetical protein [Crocosphaera sp. Alani8]|uniref:hypothetical protein n=1 Tax=Crocosphaera sp. Alani8 TaxID=3038952 RepID=UPI00313BC501